MSDLWNYIQIRGSYGIFSVFLSGWPRAPHNSCCDDKMGLGVCIFLYTPWRDKILNSFLKPKLIQKVIKINFQMKIYIPSFILTNFHENLRSSFFHGLNGTMCASLHKFSEIFTDDKMGLQGIKWRYQVAVWMDKSIRRMYQAVPLRHVFKGPIMVSSGDIKWRY